MCGIKGLGVALHAVSGIVNHRLTQALQLLPGEETEGLRLRSHPFSWWLLVCYQPSTPPLSYI